MDEDDYLKAHYDVVIYGTGLVESILACAAARCGLAVLHLDRNDYYGGNHASFNLKTFVELSNEAGDGVDESCPNLGLARVIGRKVYAAKPVTEPVAGAASEDNDATIDTSKEEAIQTIVEAPENPFDAILKQSRRFCIDLSVQLLYANGHSVQTFIDSGVANYLEFRSLEGLSYVDNNSVSIVPCSKADVFNSRFFSSMEKRVLTKFLHFVSDYGRVSEGTDLTTLNERELAQGRSLHRPQNKDINVAGYDVASFLNAPFREFMAYCKISPRLQEIILHSLCFHIRSAVGTSPQGQTHSELGFLNTERGLQLLSAHLNAVGRFGNTALLFPLYGVSELPQAFCRMSAVWGATYVLRSSVTSLEILAESVHGWSDFASNSDVGRSEQTIPSAAGVISEQLENETSPSIDAAVVSDNILARRLIKLALSGGKSITCNAFVGCADEVVSGSGLSTSFTANIRIPVVLLTRVLVCQYTNPEYEPNKGCLPLARCLEIIPPNHALVRNTHAVFVMQADSSTNVCPDGTLVLHLITQVDVSSLSDKAIFTNVGKSTDRSSSWDEFVALSAPSLGVMMDAVEATLSTHHNISAIYSSTFVRPMFDVHPTTSYIAMEDIAEDSCVDNICFTGESWLTYSVTTDDAIERARRAFATLCPGKIFMQQDERGGGCFQDNGGDDEMEYLASTLQSSSVSPDDIEIVEPNSDNETGIVVGDVCQSVPEEGSVNTTCSDLPSVAAEADQRPEQEQPSEDGGH